MNGQLSSRALVFFAYSFLFVNALFAICPTGRRFMPSEFCISLGIAYGAVCAAYHVYMIQLARRRQAKPPVATPKSKPLGGPIVVGAVAQLILGTAGVSEGVGSLYTIAAGKEDSAVHIVSYVYLRGRGSKCLKHRFEDVSYLQNIFGALCLSQSLPPGSRINFVGQSSRLGFHDEFVSIEVEGSTETPERLR
jgi:hypothetical protein